MTISQLTPRAHRRILTPIRSAWIFVLVGLVLGCSSETTPTCELGSPPAGAELYGTVCEAGSHLALPGAVVTAWTMDWAHGEGRPEALAQILSDQNGRFSFTGLDRTDPSPNFWIEAYDAEFRNESSPVFAHDGAEPVGIVLELTSGELSVFGTVTDRETGDPVEDARVWIDLEPTVSSVDGLMTRFTGADGQFRFYGVTSGTSFEIGALAEGYEELSEEQAFGGTDVLEVNLALHPEWKAGKGSSPDLCRHAAGVGPILTGGGIG